MHDGFEQLVGGSEAAPVLSVQPGPISGESGPSVQPGLISGELSSPGALDDYLAFLDSVSVDVEGAALAERTRTEYAKDQRQYELWCAALNLEAYPVQVQTLRRYVTQMSLERREDDLPRFKVSSIRRAVAAIARANHDRGFDKSVARAAGVGNVIKALENTRKEKIDQKQPLLLGDLEALLLDMDHDRWPLGVTAARDRLALLLGFATAMRRSEVSRIRLGDVDLEPGQGLVITARASKTNQTGRVEKWAVPHGRRALTCPVCHWVRWRQLCDAPTRAAQMKLVLTTGDPDSWTHLCRGEQAAGLLVNQATAEHRLSEPLLHPVTKAGAIRLDQPVSGAALSDALLRRLTKAGYRADQYGFHSLRAGFVTQALRNGASKREVKRQSHHRSDLTVDIYDRDYNVWSDNAALKLGL